MKITYQPGFSKQFRNIGGGTKQLLYPRPIYERHISFLLANCFKLL